jgi:hypothetical protein
MQREQRQPHFPQTTLEPLFNSHAQPSPRHCRLLSCLQPLPPLLLLTAAHRSRNRTCSGQTNQQLHAVVASRAHTLQHHRGTGPERTAERTTAPVTTRGHRVASFGAVRWLCIACARAREFVHLQVCYLGCGVGVAGGRTVRVHVRGQRELKAAAAAADGVALHDAAQLVSCHTSCFS